MQNAGFLITRLKKKNINCLSGRILQVILHLCISDLNFVGSLLTFDMYLFENSMKQHEILIGAKNQLFTVDIRLLKELFNKILQ